MFNLKKLIPQKYGITIFEKRFWTMWWERRTKGFDESETWSLDYKLSNFIAPRLREFIKVGPTNAIPQSFLNAEYKKSMAKGYKWNKKWWRLDNKKENKKCFKRAAAAWTKVLNEMVAGFEDEVLECTDWDAWVKKWKPTVDKYNHQLSKAKTEKEKKEIWDSIGGFGNYNIKRTVSTEDVVYKMRQHSKDLLAKYYNDLWW